MRSRWSKHHEPGAVVSTRKLAPERIDTTEDYELFLMRTIKVSLHEVGHNLGLTDHAAYRKAADGSLCPMSRGEFNKFGTQGYVRAVIDGRGLVFCDECTHFLSQVFRVRPPARRLLKDGLGTDQTPAVSDHTRRRSVLN